MILFRPEGSDIVGLVSDNTAIDPNEFEGRYVPGHSQSFAGGGSLLFGMDAWMTSRTRSTLRIHTYPVDGKADRTDTAYREGRTATMTGLKVAKYLGFEARQAYARLEKAQWDAELLTVVTPSAIFDNVLIEDIQGEHDETTGTSLVATITLKESRQGRLASIDYPGPGFATGGLRTATSPLLQLTASNYDLNPRDDTEIVDGEAGSVPEGAGPKPAADPPLWLAALASFGRVGEFATPPLGDQYLFEPNN